MLQAADAQRSCVKDSDVGTLSIAILLFICFAALVTVFKLVVFTQMFTHVVPSCVT